MTPVVYAMATRFQLKRLVSQRRRHENHKSKERRRGVVLIPHFPTTTVRGIKNK